MVSLNKLNLYATILHYSLAVGLIIYFIYMNNKHPNEPVKGVELSLRDHVVKINTKKCNTPSLGSCDSNGNNITSEWLSNETYNVNIKVIQSMLILFFLITGSFHLFYYLSSGPLVDGNSVSNSYTRAIENQNNYYRWIEYSITSTLMLYIIALISGVKDTNIYIMLFATNISMIYTGQLVEEYRRDYPNTNKWILPMLVGFIMLIVEFFVIIRDFNNRINQVSTSLEEIKNVDSNSKTIPSWIKYTIYILFLFFSCFGFISLVGAYSNVSYDLIEKAYIIASFGAKATLAMFIAYGTTQRQKAGEK